MFLAKLIIYLLISFVLPYFFTFFNYFLCLCWLSTMPFTKIFNFILHISEKQGLLRLKAVVPSCSTPWKKMFQWVE